MIPSNKVGCKLTSSVYKRHLKEAIDTCNCPPCTLRSNGNLKEKDSV